MPHRGPGRYFIAASPRTPQQFLCSLMFIFKNPPQWTSSQNLLYLNYPSTLCEFLEGTKLSITYQVQPTKPNVLF